VAAGAVLCGGRSSRMGRDKALVEVAGAPMAARVAAALRAAGCDPVVAVGGDAESLGALDLTVISDDHPGDGPLGGILTALARIPTPVDGTIVVVSCDIPWLTGDIVGALVEARRDHDVAVARTERREPLCAAWVCPAPAALAASFAAGGRAVHAALDRLDTVDVACDPAALRNVNSPADLPGRADHR
jgi:molybdopterin-guanine dinucleotide biosynthesis protein A